MSIDPAEPRLPCPTPAGRVSYCRQMYMSIRTSAYCTYTSVPTKCSTWNIGRLSACRNFLACVHGLALLDERLHRAEDVGPSFRVIQRCLWSGGKSLVDFNHWTTLTQTILYESRAARDLVLKSPMEQGVVASYDRLAELLASLWTSGEKGRKSRAAQ